MVRSFLGMNIPRPALWIRASNRQGTYPLCSVLIPTWIPRALPTENGHQKCCRFTSPVPAPTLRRSCPLPAQSPPRYKKRTIAVLVEEGEGLLELGNLLLGQLISHGCGWGLFASCLKNGEMSRPRSNLEPGRCFFCDFLRRGKTSI